MFCLQTFAAAIFSSTPTSVSVVDELPVPDCGSYAFSRFPLNQPFLLDTLLDAPRSGLGRHPPVLMALLTLLATLPGCLQVVHLTNSQSHDLCLCAQDTQPGCKELFQK